MVAELYQRAADTATPWRKGEKAALIADVLAQLKIETSAGRKAAKERIFQLHRQGALQLARLDVPEATDRPFDLVPASEINVQVFGKPAELFHLVIQSSSAAAPRGKPRAATRRASPPAPRASAPRGSSSSPSSARASRSSAAPRTPAPRALPAPRGSSSSPSSARASAAPRTPATTSALD